MTARTKRRLHAAPKPPKRRHADKYADKTNRPPSSVPDYPGVYLGETLCGNCASRSRVSHSGREIQAFLNVEYADACPYCGYLYAIYLKH